MAPNQTSPRSPSYSTPSKKRTAEDDASSPTKRARSSSSPPEQPSRAPSEEGKAEGGRRPVLSPPSPTPPSLEHINNDTREETMEAELQSLRATVARLSQENAQVKDKLGQKEMELQLAQSLIATQDAQKKSLRSRIDDMRKTNDEMSERVDRSDLAFDELKCDHDELGEHLSKVIVEKNKATAAAIREQGLSRAKGVEVREMKRELQSTVKSFQDQCKRLEQALDGQKRPRGTAGPETRSAADKAKKEKQPEERVVACTQCYTKGWPCDNGTPCIACEVRRIPERCKRMKCKFWAKGTCTKKKCGLAHEGDGFLPLVENRKVHQDKNYNGMPEVQKAVAYAKRLNDGDDDMRSLFGSPPP